jgi:multicomponent Na+:H+ antiporter subunit B
MASIWFPSEIFLFGFLIATALCIVRIRDLFGAVMLLGIFSLLSAGMLLLMDAVDVSFTEAAVGAGFSTVLLLGTLGLTASDAAAPRGRTWIGKLVVIATGALLIYATLDMPHYGDPDAPINTHVAPHYIEESDEEIGIPNIVTSILASYRGYDTFGETTVILTAAVGAMLLLGGARRPGKEVER